jgi:hypothetical protein
MKIFLLALFLVPALSFSQVSKSDKKSIDNYANTMCECVSDYITSLHPRTTEVLIIMAEKGEDVAISELEKMLEEMEPEEVEEFLGAFAAMESEEFQQNMNVCNQTELLNEGIEAQLDNELGAGYDYFMSLLNEDQCEVMKALYDIGSSENE